MNVKPELNDDYIKNVMEPIKGMQDREGHLPRRYYEAILDAADKIGEALDKGLSPSEAEKTTRGMDLTGYMMGWAAYLVSCYHPKGEEFQKYWNRKFGQPNAKGVVNPAIFILKPKKDCWETL